MDVIPLIFLKVLKYILEANRILTKEDIRSGKNGCMKLVQKDRNCFGCLCLRKSDDIKGCIGRVYYGKYL